MKLKSKDTFLPSNRSTGKAAIVSGVMGIIAVGFLIAFLTTRSDTPLDDFSLIRIHDGFVVIQLLLLIYVVLGLRRLSIRTSTGVSQSQFVIGVTALSLTILFLLLNFPKVLADVWYMFPQGIFGVWLMIVCWQLRNVFPVGIAWFGIVTGWGLTLVGTFPVGYAMLVDPIIFQIPAPSEEVLENMPMTGANDIIHKLLMIGSLMGVLTLPFWTMLVGLRLVREEIK